MSDGGKARPGERLAKALGVASVALGTPLVASPGAGRPVRRHAGHPGGGARRRLRELAAAILPGSRPLPSVWSRAAGDGVGLALLGVALRSARNRRRLTAATAGVAGIAALDAVGALRRGRRRLTAVPAAVRTGQGHLHRHLRPLLDRVRAGEIDPSFVIGHRLPPERAPEAYGGQHRGGPQASSARPHGRTP